MGQSERPILFKNKNVMVDEQHMPLTKACCNGGVNCKLKVLSSSSSLVMWDRTQFQNPATAASQTLWVIRFDKLDYADIKS